MPRDVPLRKTWFQINGTRLRGNFDGTLPNLDFLDGYFVPIDWNLGPAQALRRRPLGGGLQALEKWLVSHGRR
jgi:hypothetical protein